MDADPQESNCKLSTGDETQVELAGQSSGDGHDLSVSVEDTALNVPEGTTFTITCASFHTEANNTKLTAIAVDAIN
jgi:hypothetical protein